MRAGFVLDLNRCTGCHACRLACTIENQLESGESWRQIFTFNELHHRSIPSFHLSLACNHCLDAPCLTACPARAISRDSVTDVVILDSLLCIGCRYCSWACPYDAPRYSPAAGTMSKCTLCNHRLSEGKEPACVALCPTGALEYGGLEGSDRVDSVPGFPLKPIEPGIRFVPLKRTPPQPVCTARAMGSPDRDSPVIASESGSPISAKTEWPLAVFTVLASVLVGAFAASLLAKTVPDPALFLATAVAGLGISAVHLGKRLRAWRGVLNVRTSWLSREILCYLVFIGLSAVVLLFAPGNKILSMMSMLAGMAGLFAIDRVYSVTLRKVPTTLHSAGALLTGLFFAALFALHPLAAGLIGLTKMALYIGRKFLCRRDRTPAEWWVAVVRVGGLATAILWLGTGMAEKVAVIGLALAGELIDRLEYYQEMDILTPRSRIAADVRALLAAQPNKQD